MGFTGIQPGGNAGAVTPSKFSGGQFGGVGVAVGDGVGVADGVAVAEGVGVADGVTVADGVGVADGVTEGVGVGVGPFGVRSKTSTKPTPEVLFLPFTIAV